MNADKLPQHLKDNVLLLLVHHHYLVRSIDMGQAVHHLHSHLVITNNSNNSKLSMIMIITLKITRSVFSELEYSLAKNIA